MSNVADTAVKPAEEFVVFTDESLAASENKTGAPAAQEPETGTASALSLDTSAPQETDPNNPQQTYINRIDSFPKTLPLPASSILSPTSAAHKKELFQLPSKQEQQTKQPLPTDADTVVSPPETTSDMLVQTYTTPLAAQEDAGTTTPLAELAGTVFDQQVAIRRRNDSIIGEEMSESVSKLNVEEETELTPVVAKEAKIELPPREVFTPEKLEARKNNPAVVAALPQTPSAEDFQVARTHEGSNFNPEYPNKTENEFPVETQVAS
ncbi:hypothetical protein Dda_7612 [Drechslerella dactyloides]|uniref:Uncharacterized protein n=1 Tax=Drechslerella dactyloides TaxID=74499 RepID=A0AAD6ISH1_DREDA|nr:hypothetical protein Dda_7612 [Drechslerella dactyloides]